MAAPPARRGIFFVVFFLAGLAGWRRKQRKQRRPMNEDVFDRCPITFSFYMI